VRRYGLVFLAVLLAACAPATTSAPSAVPTTTLPPISSPTPTLTHTPTPIPSPTPTPTPTHTATPAPTPTTTPLSDLFRPVIPIDEVLPGTVSALRPSADGALWLITDQGIAKGVRVLALDAIKGSCTELAPGAVLFRYGYMPFASSIGGNEVCFDLNRNRVVWVERDC